MFFRKIELMGSEDICEKKCSFVEGLWRIHTIIIFDLLTILGGGRHHLNFHVRIIFHEREDSNYAELFI